MAGDPEVIDVGRGVVAYDFLDCLGGAEQLTLTLLGGIPDTDLCVAFRNRSLFPDERLAGLRCHELGRFPRMNVRGWRSLSGMHLFRHRAGFLADYDWALFSGSNAPVAVRHRSAGRNLYYCHTLPRPAYDLYDWHFESLAVWQRPIFRALTAYVRREYEKALAQMDCIIANSENVRNRLQRYVGLDAEVIHPPCDVTGYRWSGDGDYYLSTARLEPFKRVDLIVEAFRSMPERTLVVASGGREETRLRRLAADCPNIRFVGWQSEDQLKALVGNALATIYVARDEDFGMSPVESMAAGKPVIGVDEGGLRETVVDGETGVLLPPDFDVDALVSAVRSLSVDDGLAMRSRCERRASLFSRYRFLNRMREMIASTA